MKRFLVQLACLALLGLAARGAAPIYHNIGAVNCDEPPQVDATVFLNDGFFCADYVPAAGLPWVVLDLPSMALPYTMQNTLFFTNNAVMQAFPGFQLDYITSDGRHRPAASIVNTAGGANGPATLFGTGFLLLSATNLVNRGLLEIGPAGLMQIEGANVDLAFGGLLVTAAAGGGICVLDTDLSPPIITPTNFIPLSGVVFDGYHGIDTNSLATDQIVQQRGRNFNVTSGGHRVTNTIGGGGFNVVLGPLANPTTFVRTNQPSDTNLFIQVLFVGSSFGRLDTNITVEGKFLNITYPDNTPVPPNNGFLTAAVELRAVTRNFVTDQPIIYSLAIVDQLPTYTNYTALTNLNTLNTARPASYYVDIYPPCSFNDRGIATNAMFTNSLIYNPTYSNTLVTCQYAAYQAQLGSSPAGFILPTNTPGRIEITADSLNLKQARIRGESIVTIKTPHLMSSQGLIVDAPNVNYNIGSTNGLLSVSGTNLALPSVFRFGGSVDLWSAVWTNQTGNVVTNVGPDPSDPNLTVTNLVTNVVDVAIHVLMVDAAGLTTTAPTLLNEFTASGTNVVLSENISVNGVFSVTGESLTVNGTVDAGARNWTSTNVNIKALTNNGTIRVPETMELGNAIRPYASVVTGPTSAITAFTVSMNAHSLQHAGAITASGFLGITARDARLEGGSLSCANNLILSANNLRLARHRTSGAALWLAVTNSLTDGGVGASNLLVCNNGFTLARKPASGSLFGTTLRTQAGQFRAPDHFWAADDRGPVPAGYDNNAAIGRLSIDAVNSAFLTFSGTGAKNGLYVDYLELTGAAQTNFVSLLAINTNLVIYFADSNVPVESLDGKFADAGAPQGRLRWVSGFAGPNSSVAVLLPDGQVTTLNRALRFSLQIDTDGDGVVNGWDCYPLDPALWNCPTGPIGGGATIAALGGAAGGGISITWRKLPRGVYSVEYTADLGAGDWQPLPGFANVVVTNGELNVVDRTIPPGTRERFYRARYGP